MKMQLVAVVVCTILICGLAQADDGKILAQVQTLTLDEGVVTVLHLSPGFTTSLRLPEEVSSIVIGNPAMFKSEHSESESRLVFFKPITAQPAESNALITTKTGQEINLHLVSGGKEAARVHVD